MGRWLSRAVIAGAGATALAACNVLTGAGDLLVDSDMPDAAEASVPTPVPTTTSTVPKPDAEAEPDDAGGLQPIDASIVDGCSETGCEALPANFQLVALGSAGATCPTGFGQVVDGVENPTFDPGACGCNCALGTPPTCQLNAGNINLAYGTAGGAACTDVGQDVPAGCSTAGFLGPFIAYERQYTAPSAALTGGTCTVTANKNAMKLKTSSVRFCQATVLPQCAGKTCLPNVAPFATCIATTGDVACPAGWPTKHLIGASASFNCSAGCTCSVTGTCSTRGTLSYYPTANCSGAAGLSYAVGNGCTATAGSNAAFASHRYDPAGPSNPSCAKAGSTTPSAVLAQPSTVCCR